jgi:hypothetical protein
MGGKKAQMAQMAQICQIWNKKGSKLPSQR